jgi:PAS domain S-box-containing protein
MCGPDLQRPSVVLDALDTGLILLGRDDRIVHWNGWIAAASAIPAEAAVGRTLAELFPEAPLARLNSAVQQAVSAGASSVLTHSLHPGMLPLKTRTGRTLIFNVSVRPLGGQPFDCCLVQIADVTVSTERELVLRTRQKARYDAVVDSAPDAVLTVDADGVIQLANPAAAREFGYAQHELVGQSACLLFAEAGEWNGIWQPVLDGTDLPRALELVARRKDGSPSYVEVSASRWQSEQRVFVTAILRDVNERRAAEDALRTLNQTLERKVAERTADRDRMWRLSSDVMLVAQLDGRINAVNPAWTRLFGWSEDVLISANLADFLVPEDQSLLQAALASLSASTAPQLFELRLTTLKQGSRWIAWSAVSDGDLFQAVGRDVTSERQAAKALREAEDALRQSQKMEAIGQLTGGIAHDFNNLLTGIIGSMEVLKRRIAANRFEDIQRFMDAAIVSANRAAALTHRLLAFARRQPLDPKALNLNQLMGGMEELLRRTLGEQVRLSIVLGEGLGSVVTDAHQLENAVLNLAINARDAMPDGGELTITTRNTSLAAVERSGTEEIAPGEYVVVEVRDSGTGIPAEVLAKVFEPFFTTKPIGQGTGLGLSMIYGFAKQSRGHVTIESRVGEGTSVAIYLPLYEGDLPAGISTEVVDLVRGSGETVLLVEDDPSVRLLIAEVLRELGYACIEVGDGAGAMPVLASNARLDLMITDIGLPGMNGRQLAEAAREQRPGLKILFVTGYAEHAIQSNRMEDEGTMMVTKPFVLDALALKIRELIALP